MTSPGRLDEENSHLKHARHTLLVPRLLLTADHNNGLADTPLDLLLGDSLTGHLTEKRQKKRSTKISLWPIKLTNPFLLSAVLHPPKLLNPKMK